MNTAIRRDPLNWQAEALTDAQTAIKAAVKTAVLHGTPFAELNRQIARIIARATGHVNSQTLKEDARRSLNAFASRVYRQLREALGTDSELLSALLLLATGSVRGKPRIRAEQTVRMRRPEVIYHTDAKGSPLNMYVKDYIEQKVKPALDELARANALDPNDTTGRNSLRNLAEMQVRYEARQNEIASLRASGQKLVVCSVHADCSKRCYPWQGRVYSLDGTSGRTSDGRSYVPLETATDVEYRTKSGKIYKNGLLGFNCRHRLTAYKPGMIIPAVSKEEQRKEYEITRKQREYERRIREARDRASVYEGELPAQAAVWKKRAAELNRQYMNFSMENGRAFYPSRTKNI